MTAWHGVLCRNTWIVSFCSLLLIVLGFCIPYVLARNLSAEERANPLHFIFQLSSRFKAEYWYWEYVLFVRRICIAWFAVGTSSSLAKLAFVFVMIFFIIIQWKKEPYTEPQVGSRHFMIG